MAQKLDVQAWAITGAIVWGGYLFLISLFVMIGWDYYWFSSKVFWLLQSMYPGMGATFMGAIWGLLHGVIGGAICAGLFSWVHNVVQR